MKNKKELGQNWLQNRVVLETIAELAGDSKRHLSDTGSRPPAVAGAAPLMSPRASDIVLKMPFSNRSSVPLCVEIGPGLGTLTSSLLRRFEKVIAVEFDKRLAENLPKSFPGKNLEVVNEDILKFDFSTIRGKYVIAGNIPYYITSPILEKVLFLENRPERIVLLMQKEVAERILSEKETVLSLMVKNRASVSAGPVVSRFEFMPVPKVDSQVLVLEPKEAEVPEEVFKLIKMGFSQPRKKLIHNLSGLKSKEEWMEIFRENGISLDARAGDLKLWDWERLKKTLEG